MKKRLLVLVLALALVMTMSLCLAGCIKKEDADKNKVTVSWNYGTELLKEEKVEKGSLVTSWTPVVEGKTFMGWFSEASLTVPFDFTQPINEDTDIFAGFRSDSYVEDTNTWCLIGSGAGTLKDSNWNESAEVEENFKLTRVDEEKVNKFTIEATLYEGDAFQIRVMGTWTGQHGVGYLDGYETLDPADGDVLGEVKNADGERVFYATKGFGDSNKGWNANVAMSGIYKFTLQTFPGSSDYDVIYWERTGDAPVIEKTHEMYVVGTMNEFTADEDWIMETDQLREDFSLIINITEDMYADWTAEDENNPFGEACAAIKVKNEINNAWYGVNEQTAGEDGTWTLTTAGQNNLFLQAGQYKVTFNVTKNEAVVTPLEKGYYLAGRLDGADSWECSTAYQFTQIDETHYEVYYTVTEADYADWMGESAGVVKATFGYGGCAPELWFGNETDGENLMLPTVGLYRILLTLTVDGETVTGSVSAEKVVGYFLVGTIQGGNTWRAVLGNEMTKDGDNYVMDYTFTENDTGSWCAPDVAAIKVLAIAEDGTQTWYGGEDGGNVMIPQLGTYTITLSNGVVTVLLQNN